MNDIGVQQKKLWNFGDSWAWGFGLNESEKSYARLLCEYNNLDFQDFSTQGKSLGEIVHVFVTASNMFREGDIALITVPPDTRWYVTPENGDEVMHSISSWTDEYKKFLDLINGSIYWFQWHHSMFLAMMVYHAREKNVKLVMQHNYGRLDLIPELSFVRDYFVDPDSSMTYWLQGYDNYVCSLEDPNSHHCGPTHHDFSNKNLFFHNDSHPNQQGHYIIAGNIHRHLTQFHKHEILN